LIDAIFSTSFAHECGGSFCFVLMQIGVARDSKNLFAAIVILVIECRSSRCAAATIWSPDWNPSKWLHVGMKFDITGGHHACSTESDSRTADTGRPSWRNRKQRNLREGRP
jgi:hypothetical protein